jgi:hypothetical protein
MRSTSLRDSALLLGLLGCSQTPAKPGPGDEETGSPAAALAPPLERVDAAAWPAAHLLLTLGPDGVVVEEAIPGEFYVDRDHAEDPEEGFRTRGLDAVGAELYRRHTPTPVLVRDFLAHYSTLSTLDLLASFPDLGAFHLFVPLDDDLDEVVFEMRDGEGGWRELGRWDPARLPAAPPEPPAFVDGWTTLVETGPADRSLDITLVGDGYTADRLPLWHEHAALQAEALLAAPPLAGLAERINIHRVDAVSNESGASYDCVDECRFRDIAFRSVFAVEFINDLTGSDYRSSTLFQLGQHELDRAVSVVPTDLTIVVVNTPKYGGTSIHHAAVSVGRDTWTATGVHEFGHLLGLLADEYVSDECIRSAAMGVPRNISTEGAAVPWAHWVEPDTPLPTPEEAGHHEHVGAFKGAWNCPELYRPVEQCRMKSASGADFCPVCSEQLVLQLTRYADLVRATVEPGPDGDLIVLDTLGLDHTVRLSLDGETWAAAPEPLLLTDDEVHLEVTLHTPLVRADGGLLTERLHLRRPATP